MIFRFDNTLKDKCFPSHDTIATWVGLKRRNVIGAIRQLECYGYLVVTRGIKRGNIYSWMRADDYDGAYRDSAGAS